MGERHAPERLRLSSYPFVHDLRSRYSDVDSQGHVNNVALAVYYEDARATFNRGLFFGGLSLGSPEFHFVVARVTIDYLGEALHPGEYRVGVGLGHIGRSSMTHASGLFDGERCIGLCETVMVRLGAAGPAPFPAQQRELMEKMRFPADRP